MERMSSLRFWRQFRGWTQEKLEEVSGLSQDRISKIERGIHKPRVSEVFALARALGVKPTSVLDWLDKDAYLRLIEKLAEESPKQVDMEP